MSSIKIEGIEELNAKLGKIAAAAVLRPAMHKSLLHLRSKLDKLEPKIPGAFARTATAGQKRAVFAMARAGLADFGPNGYIRTGNTIRAWADNVESDGLTGELSNNAPGARWVFGAETQQPFHGHQPRVDHVATREAETVKGIFSAEIEKAIGAK